MGSQWGLTMYSPLSEVELTPVPVDYLAEEVKKKTIWWGQNMDHKSMEVYLGIGGNNNPVLLLMIIQIQNFPPNPYFNLKYLRISTANLNDQVSVWPCFYA